MKKLFDFKHYSKNSMLSITKNSAYKVCIIRDSNSSECSDECSSEKFVYDTQKSNQCNNEIQCENFILMRNEICIETCDETIFTLIEEKKCGLCRDLYIDNPYKLINTTGYLSESEIPDNIQLVNPFLYLLSRKEGYYLVEGK